MNWSILFSSDNVLITSGVLYAIGMLIMHPTIILCQLCAHFTNFAELFEQICACKIWKILQILCNISHQFRKYCVDQKNKYGSGVTQIVWDRGRRLL